MYFASPKYFYLFLLLIPFLLIWIGSELLFKKKIQKWGTSNLLPYLHPNRSIIKRILKNILILFSFSFLVLAIARPQIKTKDKIAHSPQGIEAIVALDISKSMLAEDLNPNRLTFAKMIISKLITLQKNSKFGLVVFAGGAYLQSPITTDLDLLQSFLQDADPSIISNQGTAIGTAIQVALPLFMSKKETGKAILIFTDGEDHEGNTLDWALKAKEKGIHIFTINTATSKGAPIPDANSNNHTQKYITDENGKLVISKSNFSICEEIALKTDGKAFKGKNISDIVSQLNSYLKKLPQGDISKQQNQAIELFPCFLLIALLTFIFALLILERKSSFFNRFSIFK